MPLLASLAGRGALAAVGGQEIIDLGQQTFCIPDISASWPTDILHCRQVVLPRISASYQLQHVVRAPAGSVAFVLFRAGKMSRHSTVCNNLKSL